MNSPRSFAATRGVRARIAGGWRRQATHLVAALACCGSLGATQAQTAAPNPSPSVSAWKLDGDLGIGAYGNRSIVRGRAEPGMVLPYGFFDFGRVFGRIDTFGIKTVPLGAGYLELAGRVSQDGWRGSSSGLHGIDDRSGSIPLGIGSLQETPYGAFFLNAFHDVNRSGGNLLEAIYAAELSLGPLTFYPQAGIEYQSAAYVRYFYGVSPTEAAQSGFAAYGGGAARNPMLALLLDTSLGGDWHLNFYVRRKWLDRTISDSPLVTRSTLDTAFVSLSYRFH